MTVSGDPFFFELAGWVERTSTLESTILFGSNARTRAELTGPDDWSDFDLHVVAKDPPSIERVDWMRELPASGFCFQIVRPATGGVKKITAVFGQGQIDVVVVPARSLRLLSLAMRCGLHRRFQTLQTALDEIATCLNSGYRFLKGEKNWGSFYARVLAETPGVRISDAQACQLAEIFACDLLWVLQKLQRGELIAAQHRLHRQLSETNLRLIRELRLRRKQPLPSFGLGRRLEALLSAHELKWVQVTARLDLDELHRAAWHGFSGMEALMIELVPAWRLPTRIVDLLRRHKLH